MFFRSTQYFPAVPKTLSELIDLLYVTSWCFMRVYDSMHECEACTRNLGLIVMEVPLSTAHIGSFHDCRRSRQSRVSVVIEQDWGILHCMHVQSCGGVPFVSFCILLFIWNGCRVSSMECSLHQIRSAHADAETMLQFLRQCVWLNLPFPWACFIMFSGLCSARTSGLLHLERSLTNRHGRWCSRRHFFSLSPGSLFPANFCNSLYTWWTQLTYPKHKGASPCFTLNWQLTSRQTCASWIVRTCPWHPESSVRSTKYFYQIDLLFSSSRGSYGARGETTEPRVAWQIWCFGSVIIRLYV